MKKRRNRALLLASASTFGLFVHNFSACASDSGKSQDANAGLKFVRDINPPQTSTSSAPILSKQKPGQRGNAPCLRWIDSTMPPQAVILCIHGLGLHNGSYEDFGKRMSRLGYAVYAVDMRGFGSYKDADGKKQVDFDGCLSDIKSTLKVLHRAHPNLPLFLLGESMGGAIALRATALYPDLVDGLISSVPSGERFKQGRSSLSVAMHLLEGPNKSFDVGTGVINQATVKPELKEAWANDPLNRMNLSPIELITFQKFMNQNHDIAPLIKDKPVLFVQGCNDKLVKPEGTVELFNELGTKDRKIQMIENGEHLIFEENQFSDAAIESLDNWIATRLAKIEEGKTSVSASLVPKDSQPTSQEPKPETKPETDVKENKASKVGTPQ
jgi:acylglycerol lipase